MGRYQLRRESIHASPAETQYKEPDMATNHPVVDHRAFTGIGRAAPPRLAEEGV